MTDFSSQFTDTLSHATRLNPRPAKFFGGGVIVLFFAALVISFNASLNSMIMIALLIFGLAAMFALFRIIHQNPWQRVILSWTITLAVLALIAGFLNSALPWPRIGNPTEPGCYWKHVFGIDSRVHCEAEYSVTTEVISALPAAVPFGQSVDNGQEQLWLVQVVEPAKYSGQNPYSAGTISLQISPEVSRSNAISLSRRLGTLGWPVKNADKGGDVVPQVPDDNEVRYFNEADKDAAIELARRVHDINPDTPVKVRDFSSLGRIASQGTLEIWLNEIGNPGANDT